MPTTIDAPPIVDKLFTTADLLAMPDDGIERWLIDGRIVEVGMTKRNKFHAWIESRASHILGSWIDSQPSPHGSAYAGEAGVRLRRDPDLTVGIDLVYLPPDVSSRVMADEETTIIDAVPLLAVEILSPSDTFENVQLKIGKYREVGVPLVWVLDPYFRTVTVHRRNQEPVMLNATQELDGGTELPGFRVPVVRLFPTDPPA
jgi:Uma2 family endonuclease